jgi:uncharacterized membrane protein
MHWLTKGSYKAIPYVQSLLGLAVIPLTYVLGRRIFGRAAAMMAALLAAPSYVLIHQSQFLLSEVLYTPAILVVAITLWDALHTPMVHRFCWARFWVGLSDLVRPTLLLFPLTVAVPLAMALGRWRVLRYWMA